MKRPLEFWATVAIALVVVYMIHDAYGSRPQPLTRIQIEEIRVEDPKDTAFEPAGVYTEWQSSIVPHDEYVWEQPQMCRLNQSDWPCMEAQGCPNFGKNHI